MRGLRLYAEDSSYARVSGAQLRASRKNWFIGWKCLAGTESLFIDGQGQVFSATCKSQGSFGRQGSYGNVFTEFKLEKNPINCARRYCETDFDLSVPKYHRPKYQEVMEREASLVESVETPVAIRGDVDQSKRVLWDLPHFRTRPLSQWKDAVHRLERFFKGSPGHITLRVAPGEADELSDFLRFITVEKGHLATVEVREGLPQHSPVPMPAPVKNERRTLSGVRILLFVPVRNAASKIAGVIEGLSPALLEYVDEVLILDNDSSDDTLKIATEKARELRGPKVVVRRNEKNYGFGGSHKLAIQYAYQNKMDYVLIVHGDDSGSPLDFLPVLKTGEFKNFDLVLSTRLAAGSRREGYPLYRYLGNLGLNLLASLVTVSVVKDFSGGPVNLYRVQTFMNKYENPVKRFADRISFAQDALLYVKHHRGRVAYVPIQYREAGGKSLYSALTQFVRSVLGLVAFPLTGKKKFS